MKTEKGISLPDDFADMMRTHPQLLTAFERMRPSCQRGYADWIDAAPDEPSRSNRV